jgi:hypothetical protein
VAVISERGPTTTAALAALGRRRPEIRVLGTKGALDSAAAAAARPRDVAAVTQLLPARAQPPAGRRKLAAIARERGMPARPEALYGFEAMRLVLGAIGEGGPDRRAVIRAALAPEERRTLLGRLRLSRGGDVRTRRLVLMRFRGGKPTVERVLP